MISKYGEIVRLNFNDDEITLGIIHGRLTTLKREIPLEARLIGTDIEVIISDNFAKEPREIVEPAIARMLYQVYEERFGDSLQEEFDEFEALYVKTYLSQLEQKGYMELLKRYASPDKIRAITNHLCF